MADNNSPSTTEPPASTSTASTAPGPSPPMSKTKLKQTTWPAPLTIPPTAAHTHTIILLHGRGGNASTFGTQLLFSSPHSSGLALPALFPGVKWIFPTAKKRRSTVLKRVPINQWFDNWSLEDPGERLELQYEGVAETSAFVAALVGEEAGEVGAGRVVLGGLSQGCAVALQVLLNWRGEGMGALGGFVGMSGWLPFAGVLDPRGGEGEDEGNGVVFGTSDGEGEGEGEEEEEEDDKGGCESLERKQLRAANTARDIASLPPLSGGRDDAPVFAQTPVFLGHGRHDEKVSVKLGEQARDVLEALGCSVRWHDYDEGHWYKVPEEIDDITDFLINVLDGK